MTIPKDSQWLYFVQIGLIIVFLRIVGYLCKRILKVPRVIGDIIGGCLLGPTIMGPEANAKLFPPATRDLIMMMGQLGIIFASMSAGAGLDYRVLKGKVSRIVFFTFINHAIPICFAAIAFTYLPATSAWRGPNYNPSAYFMFLVCIFSSSALTMVFLILDELKIFNDLSKFCIGWCCLSTIVLCTLLSVATLLGSPGTNPIAIARNFGILLCILLFLFLVQQLWNYVDRRWERKVGTDRSLLVCVIVVCIAGSTFKIEYSFLLGAFLAGMFMPFNADLRKDIVDRVRWLTRWVFLPQFYIYIGLFLNLRVIEAADWGWLILSVLLTFVAKWLLSIPIHYLLKFSWTESLFIAALANCRGFNGLVIGSAAIAAGVIGPTFYVFCVFVSLSSSAVAGPACRAITAPPKKQASTTTLGSTRNLQKDVNSPSQMPEENGSKPIKISEEIEIGPIIPPNEADFMGHGNGSGNGSTETSVSTPGERTESTNSSDDEIPLSNNNNEPVIQNPNLHFRTVIPSILKEESRKNEINYLWMDDVAATMYDPVYGLIGSRKNGEGSRGVGDEGKMNPEVTGKEIVDWIMSHYRFPLRSKAEGVGVDLVSRGLLTPLQTEHDPHYRPRRPSLDHFFHSESQRPIMDDTHKIYRLNVVEKPISFDHKELHSTPNSNLVYVRYRTNSAAGDRYRSPSVGDRQRATSTGTRLTRTPSTGGDTHSKETDNLTVIHSTPSKDVHEKRQTSN